MSLELKNIKYSNFASQETHCYEASLYFKGKKVATVSNDGHGGCDHQHFTSKEAEEAVHEWLWGIGGEWLERIAAVGECTALEFWCCYRVNDWLEKKDLKRLLAKRVIYTKIGMEGLYQTNAAKNARQRDAWVDQAKDWEGTEKVLNLLPFDDAMEIYRESIQ